MEIIVSGRHIEITDPIRDYATNKVSKLPRYHDRVRSIEVVADKSDQSGHNFQVEILVEVDRHEPFVSKVSGMDLYACVDLAVDKLERQLTDFKEKTRNHKHPRA